VNVDPGFGALYEREFTSVFRAVFLLCGDRSAAEDATQEAFARALVRWRRLEGQPWAAGWVMTTAMNLARRSMRRRPPSVEDPLIPNADHDARMDVRRELGRLPARQQEAIALHYLLDLSVADTAAAMSVAEGTVKTHLARARQALTEPLSIADSEDVVGPEDASSPGIGSKGRTNDD
jgi:RNA polymerase sigma-70 factor, ECF subfamily